MRKLTRISLMAVMAWTAVSCNNTENSAVESTNDETQAVSDVAGKDKEKIQVIAFINTDTLLEKYQLAIDLRDKLNAEKIKYEGILSNKEKKLYEQAAQLQRDAPTLTQFEGQTRQKKLYEDQEKLQKLQDQYMNELMDIEAGYNKQMNQAIHDYLETYCSDKPYEMVISNSELGLIRWASKDLDITSDVLKGLNEEYAAKQSPKKDKEVQ